MTAARLLDQIWDRHVIPGARPVIAGAAPDEVPDLLYIDLHLIHESTSAQAFAMLQELAASGAGTGRARRPELTLATADHSVPTGLKLIAGAAVPATTGATTDQARLLERNARAHRIDFRGRGSGRQGIVHVIAPEAGLVQPGMTAVCGDSHTSTLGAFGAFAIGVGTTAVGQVLATQTAWLTRPKALAAEFTGTLAPGVEAKDMVLALIQRIGVSGAQGHAIEFRGDTVLALPMEARMTLCNMAPEAGARAGMIGPDDVTFAYLRDRELAPAGARWNEALRDWSSLGTSPGAAFDTHVQIDAARIKPMVTWGTTPAMSVAVDGNVPEAASTANPEETAAALEYMGLRGGERIADLRIDVVFIGSCTNSRLADLRAAARVVGTSRVAAGLRAVVVPGSERVAAQAEREGLRRVFEAAGFEWGLPGCSMCVAMNGDQVPPGQRCAATSNRNFRGRQGPGARTHLVSPATRGGRRHCRDLRRRAGNRVSARNPIAGTCVLLAARNIDTDQIMPKQFCLRNDRHGYHDAVFFEWRQSVDSPLNQPRARSSPLLVAGPNFGCGSSREHAVWGLLDFGFRAVVATSYGDTFRANAGAAGLVTARIGASDCERLLDRLHRDIDTPLALDVATGVLGIGTGDEAGSAPVQIPAFHRHLYLGGFTELELAAAHDADIGAYEADRPAWMPRVDLA